MKSEYFRVFRAFADENRVRALELLCEGEQCACVLLDDMEISQPTLSHHMKILCESGIVKSRREGRWNYYSINTDGCEYGSRLLDAVANREMKKTLHVMRRVCRFLHPVRTLSVLWAKLSCGCRSDKSCSCDS
jgi:ArsR family transcriptional regulator